MALHSNPSIQSTSKQVKEHMAHLDMELDHHQETDDYQGSLEGESEDEWAEERKAVKYVAESEMEAGLDSMSDDSSEQSSSSLIDPSHSRSIGSLLKARKINNTNDNQKDALPNDSTRDPFHGKKKPNQEITHSSENNHTHLNSQTTRKSIQSRTNKHAPIEISSKKAVTRKRTIVQVPKIERRDPRFDTLSGALNEDLHEKSFAFLKTQRQAEIEKLNEMLNKAKKSGRNSVEIEKLEEELRKEENRQVQREKIEHEKQAIRTWKATEREKRKQGKGAFYLKRKAQKEIVLAHRYEHLSQNKFKLDKSIQKKRKKIDGKEKKSMPSSRQKEVQ